MPWCSHHPTFTSVMVYSTELRRRVLQSVGVTAAVSACCMMHLGDVEVTESALSAVCALGAPLVRNNSCSSGGATAVA